MHAFVARLRDSERAWSAALFCGLCLVLASGRPAGAPLSTLLAQASAAALGTLLAVWVARASGLRRHGLAMALAALFTTPLLPYAFVAHELTQALFLFAAGFLAIGPTRLRSPARDLGLLAASAGTLASEPGGPLLLPLLLWLAWCGAERRAAERRADPKPGFYFAAAVLLAVFAARTYTLERSAIEFVASPVDWLVNVHGLLLSLNKGLLLFAPLVLFGLWRSFRGTVADHRTGRFALFAATSLIVPYAGLTHWSDASWGPRHLLAAMAPALLALALSRTERARRGGHRRWIIAAVVLGLATNTLGTAVPQATLANLAGLRGEQTSVALQFDPAWNHPRVNATVLGGWLRTSLSSFANPSPIAEPAAARPAEVVRPSPVLLRVFDSVEGAALLPLAFLLTLLGLFGWALLVLVRHAAQA